MVGSCSLFVGIVDSSFSKEVVNSSSTQDSESHTMGLKRGADTSLSRIVEIVAFVNTS